MDLPLDPQPDYVTMVLEAGKHDQVKNPFRNSFWSKSIEWGTNIKENILLSYSALYYV